MEGRYALLYANSGLELIQQLNSIPEDCEVAEIFDHSRMEPGSSILAGYYREEYVILVVRLE